MVLIFFFFSFIALYLGLVGGGRKHTEKLRDNHQQDDHAINNFNSPSQNSMSQSNGCLSNLHKKGVTKNLQAKVDKTTSRKKV